MSELKAYHCNEWHNEYTEFYLKSDVDAYIDELKAENAELKKKLMPCLNGDCILTCEVVEKYGKENAELKADYKEACDRLQTANLIKDEQLAATRHHKYKLCLANAKYWIAVRYHCVDEKHQQRAERHHYKWLELAERFKED